MEKCMKLFKEIDRNYQRKYNTKQSFIGQYNDWYVNGMIELDGLDYDGEGENHYFVKMLIHLFDRTVRDGAKRCNLPTCHFEQLAISTYNYKRRNNI